MYRILINMGDLIIQCTLFLGTFVIYKSKITGVLSRVFILLVILNMLLELSHCISHTIPAYRNNNNIYKYNRYTVYLIIYSYNLPTCITYMKAINKYYISSHNIRQNKILPTEIINAANRRIDGLDRYYKQIRWISHWSILGKNVMVHMLRRI